MKDAQDPKDYNTPHEREFNPNTGDESPKYGVNLNPEQASVNLKKKRKRIQR